MKKVLSFALILALVLGSFSFAFGLSDVTAGDTNSEAITVCNDLGIVEGFPDGSFKPEQNVTRAEFAAMITRALAIPESALAAYSVTSFKDTAGYGWAVPYLAFCESKGIMIGDGYGNVMPGRTINVNEAITMAVRTVGYTEGAAALVGTWPGNYVTLGQTLGMYDDVANATIVTRENAAQVIYNALTVGTVTIDGDGTAVKTGKTLLTAGLGATVADATVINGTEGSLINLVPYIGAFAVKYLNSDNKVISIGSVDSTFLTGSFDGSVFTADDVDYTGYSATTAVPTGTGSGIFVNGKIPSPVVANVGAFPGYTDGDKVTLSVKLNGKVITSLYAALIWDANHSGTAALFEAGDLAAKTLMNKKFTLDDNDKIDHKTFELVGVNSLEDIAVDNVVSVYTDKATDKITKVEVGTKTVTGTVERLKANTDIVINGTSYSKAYNGNANFPTTVGDEGILYLDVNGDGFYWDVTDATADNYAMVVGTAGAFSRDNTVVLFDKAGVEKEYTLKSDVATTGAVGDALVTFSLDSSSKIDEMNVLTIKYDISGTKALSESRALFAGKVIADGVIVFVENDKMDYEIGALTDIDTDTDFLGTSRYFADATTGKVKVIIVPSNFAGGADTTYGVMNNVETAKVGSDTVSYIEYLADGKELKGYTNKSAAQTIGKVSSNANGLYSFRTDSAGVVTKIATVAGVKAGTLQARTDNSVKLGSDADFVAIADTAKVYLYDNTADAGKKYTLGLVNDLKVGTKLNMVYLYDTDSKVAGYDYVIYEKENSAAVAVPSFTAQGALITLGTDYTVHITATAGDEVYYTLDGTTPTMDSAECTSAGFVISQAAIVKAVALNTDYGYSSVVTGTYTQKLSALSSLAVTNVTPGAFASGTYNYDVDQIADLAIAITGAKAATSIATVSALGVDTSFAAGTPISHTLSTVDINAFGASGSTFVISIQVLDANCLLKTYTINVKRAV